MKTRITELFGIEYPIISGGMVWCSGWELAAAVSNSGGLGLIGAGSMCHEVLSEHIHKCRQATSKPFGVNIPIFYSEIEKIIDLVIDEKVPIVFTSGGNPAIYTSRLKEAGIKVAHVVANSKFAIKAANSGVDAIVAEGFEAGGHNGRDEITTMALIPQVRAAIDIPLIAAGGIATGSQMLATMVLGAEGVQIGTRFALSQESSAHEDFKKLCITLGEGDTALVLKKLTPVRLVRNEFYNRLAEAEARGADAAELKNILGSKRSKLGIFDGDLVEGELEIGQVTSMIRKIQPVDEIIDEIVAEFRSGVDKIKQW